MAEKWTRAGSRIASLMFVMAMIRQYCPRELGRFLEKHSQKLLTLLRPDVHIFIHEFTANRLRRNEAFVAVEAYLSSKSTGDVKRLKAEMAKDGSNKMVLSTEEYEKVSDDFQGVTVSWVSSKMPPASSSKAISMYQEPERRFYKLTFHKKHRQLITGAYLEHVAKEGKLIISRNRQRRLYTNFPASDKPSSNWRQGLWSHVAFEHPATFDSLAMELEKKQEIVDDLLTFSQSKDFYTRVGKAWKRGYLLYGPPGTGKSTMIAAMANLLNYDVYDLELTAVKDNTELRKLLIDTTSKSMIVIEDIDCSLDLTGQRRTEKSKQDGEKEDVVEKEVLGKGNGKDEGGSKSKVTLSGLLNFIDGVWSASGGERIIVFTTNRLKKLDPALIRRGRMDKHIELSYCNFEGFKILAKNYLKLETHPLFDKIRVLIEENKITPADVAENLMPKCASDDQKKCLMNLVQALEEAKEEGAEREAKKAAAETANQKETIDRDGVSEENKQP